MSNDFGWFLVWLGAVSMAFIMPINTSFLVNHYSLPLGLIFFGALSLLFGYFGVKSLSKVNGVVLAVFFVLLFRAYAWNMPLVFLGQAQLSDSLSQSFNASNTFIDCSVCDVKLLIGDELNFDVSYNAVHTSIISSVVNDSLFVNTKSLDSFSRSLINLTIPANVSPITFSAGVGRLAGSLALTESNISLGVGKIDLNISVNGSSFVSVGVGSVDLLVDSVVGNSLLSVNAGVGSIVIDLPESLDYSLELSTGLGGSSVLIPIKSSGFDNASNRLLIIADTGVGSISII
ncbi:MAG: hypothetical protein WC307_05370 [Candidatus Nanoarchaeia archaeon]